MTENKKSKQIKIRVNSELYEDLHEIPGNMSDFVREAIEEKMSAMLSSNSGQARKIKELELIIETKKSQINSYQQIIDREQSEINEMESQIQLLYKQMEKDEQNSITRKERLIKNPKFIEEMDENIKLILRKKYLRIELAIPKTFQSRADKANITVDNYKELLKEYVDKEYYVGREIELSNDKKITLNENDMEYISNRLIR